jgi:CobQ-like glutamine amidotransferase family enzyme
MNYSLTIGYLYPEYMNIYGDTGNIVALQMKAAKQNIAIKLKEISAGTELQSGEVDIYFFGGGQDQQQVFVSQDIQRLKETMHEDIANGAVALTICGGYQLFGKCYRPFDTEALIGLDIFPLETHASTVRMINNLVVETNPKLYTEIKSIYTTPTEIPKTLVGFENHSGQTYLEEGTKTLGKTVSGYGNNASKQYEGCWLKNAFGTYMHGSLLPKNPHFTDYLIYKALEYRYKEQIKLIPQPNTFEYKAHNEIVRKYSNSTY